MSENRYGVYDPINFNNRWGTPLMDIAGPTGRFSAANTGSTADYQYQQWLDNWFNDPSQSAHPQNRFSAGYASPQAAMQGGGGGASAVANPGAQQAWMANAGAGGGAGSAAAGSWWQNPRLWTTIGGAALNYLGARDQNEFAAQANAPRPFWEQRTPYGPAQANIDFGLQEALRRYQNQPGGPGGGGRGGRGGRRGGGGGGGGGFQAVTPQQQALLDSITGRAMGVPDYISQAQGSLAGMMGGGGDNPYLQGTYGQASTYANPYLDQFIQGMMGELPQQGSRPRSNGFAASYGMSPSMGGGGGGNQWLEEYEPNEWLREELDRDFEYEANPYLDEMIAASSEEAREYYLNNLAPSVDAEYMRAGRYGSGSYAEAQARAAEEFGETIGGLSFGARGQDYQSERDRYQQMREQALGLMTQGELGMMSANASRYGSDQQRIASERSAAASAGASRYNADLQAQIANRGLLLDAIGGRSNDDLARMGLMGDMAGLFTDERLGALGAIPGLEEASWLGPQVGWGAQMDTAGLRFQDQARRDAQARAAQDAAFQRWNAQQRMDSQRFDDLMRWSMMAGDTFGRTEGAAAPNTMTPRVNPWAAAIQGGMGGWMSGGGFA